ncbi:MAG: putative toxin-antitoxin system toxin component, PIN family [Candidatus Doudnabacteria bacterium]|nr:putative toxin-antitoxin system toxin component, PIN family [Candidatus Doudnabacteria bacterium]
MKIVLDTNVLINGFRDEYSFEKKIIDAVIAGEIAAFANRQTLQENKLISGRLINNDEYKNQLDNFYTVVNWVVNRRQVRVVSDPEDNKILESAIEAGADYLITSDNDLLSLEKYQEVKIVNPSQFWAEYKDEGMDLWKQWTGYITKHKT